jgi:hypothetical protein
VQGARQRDAVRQKRARPAQGGLDCAARAHARSLARSGGPAQLIADLARRSRSSVDEANDTTQKNITQEQMTMFWNDEDIKGIPLWGYVVGATWQSNSGLQQDNGTMRSAMSWLMDFLGR